MTQESKEMEGRDVNLKTWLGAQEAIKECPAENLDTHSYKGEDRGECSLLLLM